ncbi:MAG TPA: squalene/phytoene synthase family protein, partial [Geminicoccaceae bacterium]|nr:squalene/phytoene synthase family protein [Geminicoccaceae bacterium]
MRSLLRSEPGRARLSHCAADVRAHDPDRYLATLFAPAEIREALFVLYAFDHEIGRVRRIVTEPMAGLVRLQWWRDALAAIAAGRPPAHPVAEGLHVRWAGFQEVRARLDAAIDAREQDLGAEPPADLAGLEERLGASSGEITLAALDLLEAKDRARAAGRHLGLALGLVRLVQSLPGDVRHNRVVLPD